VNRGHGRERILANDADKKVFLDILTEASKRLKIRVLAYCLMDSHYHLVIENSSGRMADFFKLLNGDYGTYYRKRHGGNGYIFQGRYKSTLIQDDGYLMMAISYVLANPVRAGHQNAPGRQQGVCGVQRLPVGAICPATVESD
jgi:putative transposase